MLKLLKPEKGELGQERAFPWDALKLAMRDRLDVPQDRYIPQRVAHILHDYIESTNAIGCDKQQLVGILLVREAVDVTDFALSDTPQLGQRGVGESGGHVDWEIRGCKVYML
jgi:hypothetical protein